MSDFNFATWRLGLHRQLANAAVIEPPLLEQLDGAWGQAHSAFETTGAISLQFISYIERKFPYEFNLLVSPLFLSFAFNECVFHLPPPPPPPPPLLHAPFGHRRTPPPVSSVTASRSSA